MSNELIATIDAAWEDRANVNLSTQGPVRQAVDKALAMLDSGELRVAEPTGAEGSGAGRSINGRRRRCCCPSASTTMR